MTQQLELIILMGMPGAGKSSFFRHYFKNTYAHVSKDLMKNKKNKDERQRKLISAAFEEGTSVVVDNMNLTFQNRRQLIDLGHAYNARVVLYYFPISVEESFKQNAGPGRTVVPPVAIYSAAKNLDVPKQDEDFDEVFVVKLKKVDDFEIKTLNY